MPAYILTLLLSTGVLGVEVNTLDGEYVRGEVVELTESALVVSDADGELREIPREGLLQVVSTGDVSEAAELVTVALLDGSEVHAAAFATQEGMAHLELVGGREMEFPSELVASVRLWRPSTLQDTDWLRILAMDLSGDVLILRREGDALDYLEGFAGEVSDENVDFTFEEREYSADRERVEGVLYASPPEEDLPHLTCVLEEIDGSLWQAHQIVLEDNAWHLTTRAGVEVRVPLGRTRMLDFSSDKLVYLSSLSPDRQTWSPFLESGFPLQNERYMPRFNESLDGGPLRLLVDRDGHEEEMSFQRGIALHSRSELVYRLPAGFRKFQALAGIDERVRPYGSVRLVIIGDNRTLFEGEIFSSTAEGQPVTAVPLDIDIEGVRRLTIRVDFGEGQDVGDHLDLANAQIRK